MVTCFVCMTCRFAIVGWSDGGIVALLTAIHHPEAVTKVCHFHLYICYIDNMQKLHESKERAEIQESKKSQF